ncbi:probable tubulin polyglutamylase ttll-15 [Watersipora subatra]|uniref:probable tubulin polyglutamylase ttll-15 n=1 Tax=Watersipora subatra TaxID=2589382 RepID=UPI00355B97DF
MILCDREGNCGTTHKDHRLSPVGRITSICRLSSRNLRHYTNFPTFLLLVTLFIGCLTLHEIRKLNRNSRVGVSTVKSGALHPNMVNIGNRQAWIKAKHLETGYLKHVTGVLESLGYSLDGGTYSDWNVMWAHDYPFGDAKLKEVMLNLKPHQKVNKWPGSGYVTSKVSLATSSIRHIPKAFQLPARANEFKAYAEAHPDTLWVQKSNKHRGIRITPVSGLDLSMGNTFIQQYVDKPLIIDKKKFDIGIYTIITSISPLRIYIIDHEFLLRFCYEEYYPFDASNVNKYIVADEYTPIWEIPSLNKYYGNGFSAKFSFSQYLRDEGRDPSGIFQDIESTIRDVYISKLSDMRDSLKNYHNKNFFEMVRFDFVLDDALEVYLMEVNMSPNLSSGHFTRNRLLYEQVVYNLLHVVGAATRVEHHSKLEVNEQEMRVGPRDLSVDPDACVKHCADGCKAVECRLCYPCMTSSYKEMLQEAYLEHVNRRSTKRIMPPTMSQATADERPDYWQKLSDQDRTMHLWFAGKCKENPSWC